MPVLGVEKFKPSAIRDTVRDALRQSLLEGRFQPGEDLSEVAIASEFHISRGPVREAMLVLASEGLLCHTQNRGFYVLNFTADDLIQIDKVRCPLESLALLSARQNVTVEDLDHLKAIKDNLGRAFEQGDQYERWRSEIEFHNTIWELSGNPWLVAVLKRVMIPSFTYGTALRMERRDLSRELLDQLHNLYIEFLEGASTHTAEECVRLHIGLPATDA